MKKAVPEINDNIPLNAVASLPSKVLEYVILIFLVIRKRTFLKANVIKPILSSKLLTAMSLIVIVLDLSFTVIMGKAIGYDKMLVNLSFWMQLGITIGAALFPVINITALLWGVYYKENQAVEKQKAASEELDKLAEMLKSYTSREKCDNIDSELDEIVRDIKEVSQELFKEEEKPTRKK